NWIGPMLSRFVGHVQGRPWLRHRDNGDGCIVMLGEGKPVFESLRRQFRAVGCNQDMFVHRWTSSAPPIYHGCRGTRALSTGNKQAHIRQASTALAEKGNDPPPLHSITSSARASRLSATVRPRALAVLRLITSSYLVGACTGRSAGFVPFRMRST